MSIVGDSSQFVDLFPDQFIPDILQLVVSTWQKFHKDRPSELEELINKWFGLKLRKEKERVDNFPFKIHPEIDIFDSNTGKTKGRIDILLYPTYTTKEDVYFAFECKRLRIQYNSKITANTSEYVGSDGMMCFITEQYSKDLSSGGMIGYVMDGKVNLAIQSVKKAIDNKRIKLCMTAGDSLSSSSILPDESSVKETIHNLPARSGNGFLLTLKKSMI